MSYKSIFDALNAPKSRHFNACTFDTHNSGMTGHKESYYAVKERYFEWKDCDQNRKDSSLSFDISNTYINASVDIEGTIQDARIATGLKPIYHPGMRGVFVQKKLINGRLWKFDIEVQGNEKEYVKTTIQTDLLENALPLTSFKMGMLRCKLINFAVDSKNVDKGIPAIIQILQIVNSGNSNISGNIKLPGNFINSLKDGFTVEDNEQSALLLMEQYEVEKGKIAISLKAEEEILISVALILGENKAGLEASADILRNSSTLDWLNDTLEIHKERFGSLKTEDSYYGEALVRMAELCRQSNICMADGSFVGGFLGSNVNPGPDEWGNTNVWMKDNYYSSLPMAIFNPKLCEKAIKFYMNYGVPPFTWGRGVARFPDADGVVLSISNSLDGIALAVAYYQMNGNTEFFNEYTNFLSSAKAILDRVYSTRQYEDIYLFPSMYVSDGDARGDFHTGSNVVAWYAFNGMARICKEVYGDIGLAKEWKAIAEKIKNDIKKYCTGYGILGKQYYEGAFIDGTFAPGHDGEESDVTLMPFYGFEEADSPLITRFSKLGFTSHNPHYFEDNDAIGWFDAEYYSKATFPAFTTKIAAAENEVELHDALESIRRLTDLDGSIWWWPHNMTANKPSDVRRWLVKCCWAAGVYTLKVINDVLGIQIDKPAQKIRFSPYTPWDGFNWEDCKIGSSKFDFNYTIKANGMNASVTNKNLEEFKATVELTLPEGVEPVKYSINDMAQSHDLVRFKMKYGRKCYVAYIKLAAGETLNFDVQYRKVKAL